jgi:hypothetical protein
MLLKKLFGTNTVTPTERDLLATIRVEAVPDPDKLREQLAALNSQIDDAEREWERLDRRGDAASFLQLQPIAEQLRALRVQAATLPMAIEAAERRRSAFLSLVRLFDAVAADVAARTQMLLERPPQDARERDAQIRALDQATRVHVRLAGRLSSMSANGQFRDPPDALKVLRDDLERRVQELDKKRTPGMRPPFVMPAHMSELLDVMEGRMSRKETA